MQRRVVEKLLLTAGLVAAGCGDGAGGNPAAPPAPVERERFRPRYHLTPRAAWMNDPNGLVFADGLYHVFYQHDPDFRVPLRQHWGHATSVDGLRWEHRPVALFPDPELGLAYSGSAVVDARDTSSLCAAGSSGDCVVAVFTHSGGSDGRQKQSLAVWNAARERLEPFAGNPVLERAEGGAFRDPKVFWHEATARWVMVVAAGDRAQLYASADLRAWTLLSEVGADLDLGGIWECPELFELEVEGGGGERRWVLQVDVNRGPFLGFSEARYLVGDFDGERFTPDDGIARLVDHGADFYAAQSVDSAPDGRHVWLAWMSNWKYALTTPTDPWRGALSVFREVGLVAAPDGPVLRQRPLEELVGLRTRRIARIRGARVEGASRRLDGVRGTALDLVARLRAEGATRVVLGLRVGAEERTELVWDVPGRRLSLDRTRSGLTHFDRRFAAVHGARLPDRLPAGRLDLRVLVDSSSVEVFAADGTVAITDLIFPDPASDGLTLEAEGGALFVELLEVHALADAVP